MAIPGPVRPVRPNFTARCFVKGEILTRVPGPTAKVSVAAALTNAAPAPLAVTFTKPH